MANARVTQITPAPPGWWEVVTIDPELSDGETEAWWPVALWRTCEDDQGQFIAAACLPTDGALWRVPDELSHASQDATRFEYDPSAERLHTWLESQ